MKLEQFVAGCRALKEAGITDPVDFMLFVERAKSKCGVSQSNERKIRNAVAGLLAQVAEAEASVKAARDEEAGRRAAAAHTVACAQIRWASFGDHNNY